MTHDGTDPHGGEAAQGAAATEQGAADDDGSGTARPKGPKGRRRWPAVVVAVVVVLLVVGLALSRCGGTAGTAARDSAHNPGPLHVSGRTVLDRDGKPAVWVADTAWMLTTLTREDVDRYLDRRAAQGFTVIQFSPVFLPLDQVTDGYGHRPFEGDDVRHPRTTLGADPAQGDEYDFWDHVDYVVRAIHERSMTAAMFPIWSVNHAGETLDAGNAAGFGEFLGKRYGGAGVVQVLGGDDKDPHGDIWPPLAQGIRSGASSAVDSDGAGASAGTRTTSDTPLLAYHPAGMQPPTYAWLGDVAMYQTSHCVREGYVPMPGQAYDEVDGRPVIDVEPLYEDHPWCWEPDKYGYATAEDVRRQQYWGLFAGGFGVTYGHNSVWQFYVPGKGDGVASPRASWQDALSAPGAEAMRHVGELLRSQPMDRRVPDDSLIRDGLLDGWDRRAAMRDEGGRWAMAYLPSARPITLDVGVLASDRVRLTWVDPSSGATTAIGERAKADVGSLTPPQRADVAGRSPDWVLVAAAL